MSRRVYQLKATILETRPSVWRRLQVIDDTTLSSLHDVLQAAFGWSDCHLHEYDIDGIRYGVHIGDDWAALEDERRTQLRDVVTHESAFLYTYDFDDFWRHRLEVEKVMPPQVHTSYPSCVDGRRACPPEECGGPERYREFLAVLSDPFHPEHDAVFQWVRGHHDASAFDPDSLVGKLKLAPVVHF